MTDQEIVDRIKVGDDTAVSYLYDKYYKMGTNVITKNNGNDDDAKDIYQEAVILVWKKIMAEKFVLSSKLGTFFYGICYKLWLKELSRRKKYENNENEKSEYILDNDEYTISSMEDEQIKEVIRENLDNISESDRNILFYFYIENKTMEEISSILGYTNPDSAKVKKHRAKAALAEIIKSKYKFTDFLD